MQRSTASSSGTTSWRTPRSGSPLTASHAAWWAFQGRRVSTSSTTAQAVTATSARESAANRRRCERVSTGTERVTIPGYGYATSTPSSPLAIVRGCVRRPSFSCQVTRLYTPGGRSGMDHAPSAFVTAK